MFKFNVPVNTLKRSYQDVAFEYPISDECWPQAFLWASDIKPFASGTSVGKAENSRSITPKPSVRGPK